MAHHSFQSPLLNSRGGPAVPVCIPFQAIATGARASSHHLTAVLREPKSAIRSDVGLAFRCLVGDLGFQPPSLVIVHIPHIRDTMARRVSRYVNKANEATAAQLARDVLSIVCLKDTTLHLQVKLAAELTAEERDIIWGIVDTNMRDLSSGSSMGWDEKEKRKELFDPVTSRFIIVHHPTESPVENAGIIAAFVMFKFEYDQGERLLYCYEIQVAEPWRNYGVGRFLVSQVVEIARRYKMEKVMLTVLKANQGACRFYTTMGFTKDESSPDYVPEGGTDEDVQECDYNIMSYVL